MPVTSKTISQAAKTAGLNGRAVFVHSSLRSFGRVDGGPQAVIDGLLDSGCTVMVPTFSMIYEVTPPRENRPARNGIDYETYRMDTSNPNLIYTTNSNELNDNRFSMGAIPKQLLSINGRYRGDHPRGSFAAVGPKAEELISTQSNFNWNGPIKKLSEMDGMIVLMGVGLTRMTTLHLAEQIIGRKPFRRWVNDESGDPIQVDFGSCSEGFGNLDMVLSTIEKQTRVGNSLWRVFPVPDTLRLAIDAIKKNPMITHCDKVCLACDDAIAGGPVV
tara:strand:+ start:5558 stop:6379 length:822 start_codon:yes stop_codon:yes gene_type:complete